MSTKLSAYNQEAQAVIDNLEAMSEREGDSAVAAQRLEGFGPLMNSKAGKLHSALLQVY